MGCELSRFFIGYISFCPKQGRKRLSSGDSDFRQDVESQEYDEKANDKFVDYRGQSLKETNAETKLARLRKVFSRRTKMSQAEPKKLVSSPNQAYDQVAKIPTLEEAAESAVRNRNVEQLLVVMQQSGNGFDLFPPTGVPKKFNPVELASSLGYYEIVDVFLENGCSPNLPTTTGKLLHTVLESLKAHEESIETGRQVVKHLINAGCDVDIKDRCGITPLMHCAQIGDSQIMRAVLDKCSAKQLNCHCSGSQYTPLHMSAMRGDFECVKMLLSHSSHKHINEKDKFGNTALHLALKSMLHNIPYLNAARASLESCTAEQSVQTTATCERLMRFQQNAVAIVEALVMAGAHVHVSCFDVAHADKENYYPLVYALRLCAEDTTLGFELDSGQFSSTLNLVSRKTIQSLEDLEKASAELPAQTLDVNHIFSPYAGVVRLLVLAGTKMSEAMRRQLYNMFTSLHYLLDEMIAFWDRYEVSKPPKLVHLSKLRIRAHLADVHQLHEINKLPLPPRMKDYLKLNYL